MAIRAPKEKIDTINIPKSYLRNTLFRMLTEYGEYQDAKEQLELQIDVLEDAGNTMLASIKEIESIMYGSRPWDAKRLEEAFKQKNWENTLAQEYANEPTMEQMEEGFQQINEVPPPVANPNIAALQGGGALGQQQAFVIGGGGLGQVQFQNQAAAGGNPPPQWIDLNT